MGQETIDRRVGAVEVRTGKLETKVRDLDEAIYRIDRNLIGGQIMFDRIATALNVEMVTEEEIDGILEDMS
ncbi:hypothetical protein KO481_07915 [Nocardia sp. NEAU-G5]|uniref:Uncharacterized protein n=1 Tax=Nocardia albiluteola TaxID=2842303 RepID=A0ABS6ATV3_9NOCA|nr:hypothetical protein [Nocardia albiluteola]MBU3061447.1 hypothetical protein [Nocardia albiluteola]